VLLKAFLIRANLCRRNDANTALTGYRARQRASADTDTHTALYNRNPGNPLSYL
jgi:hypothetical protein